MNPLVNLDKLKIDSRVFGDGEHSPGVGLSVGQAVGQLVVSCGQSKPRTGLSLLKPGTWGVLRVAGHSPGVG